MFVNKLSSLARSHQDRDPGQHQLIVRVGDAILTTCGRLGAKKKRFLTSGMTGMPVRLVNECALQGLVCLRCQLRVGGCVSHKGFLLVASYSRGDSGS